MTDYTRDDLKIILSFGVHLAKLDKVFDPFEKKVLGRFADAMNLEATEKSQLLQREVSLGEGLRSLSGQSARILLLKTLCAVSHSDGESSSEEMEFIEHVIETIGSQVFVLPRAEWGVYEDEVLSAFNGS